MWAVFGCRGLKTGGPPQIRPGNPLPACWTGPIGAPGAGNPENPPSRLVGKVFSIGGPLIPPKLGLETPFRACWTAWTGPIGAPGLENPENPPSRLVGKVFSIGGPLIPPKLGLENPSKTSALHN